MRRIKIYLIGFALLALVPIIEFMISHSTKDSGNQVIINEIFYHPGSDDERLEYVELYNTSGKVVNLSGWEFLDGIEYQFVEGSVIEPDGYLVLCGNLDVFRDAYGFDAYDYFSKTLSNNGERIQLADEKGRRIDSVKYKDRAPWPISSDGYSASLERICPHISGELYYNWGPSVVTEDVAKAGGTPGQKNSMYSETLPPTISSVSFSPKHPKAKEPLQVTARVSSVSGEVAEVMLLYRTASPGMESDETAIPMTKIREGYVAKIPGYDAGKLIRFRIKATNKMKASRFYPSEHDIRPALSAYVMPDYETAKIPLCTIIHVGKEEHEAALKKIEEDRLGSQRRGFGRGFRPPFGPGFRGAAPETPLPAQGDSAFVYVDPITKEVDLFDFINITSRKGGYKVRFHKDQMLKDIKTLNVIYEGNPRFTLAEVVAYELYKQVGSPSLITDFVRLTIDENLLGYHLAFEQPNKAFLRRNNIDDRGNMYKIQWMGRDLIGKHEKKSYLNAGHDDLIEIVEALESTEGDEQWDIIQKNFNVGQVANYFAVNMVLSHWDGFFNNYFIYHDIEGTGKWEMYPWDQDKTQGYYDGVPEGEVFFDMPLTFGMEGDERPGGNAPRGPRPDFPREPGRRPERSDFGGPERTGGPEIMTDDTLNREEAQTNQGNPRSEFRLPPNERPLEESSQERPNPPRGRGFGRPGGFGGFGGGGARWWREGGYISRPLLANPHFRNVFLKQIKDITEKVYVEDKFNKFIDELREKLIHEVEIRAVASGLNPVQAINEFDQSIESLREHLTKRREFILSQVEIQKLKN